ncbi:hypothetical protein GYMLUDRAFT_245550 [Collybiopsis luxurians FD-317 M1]|uniref:Uncharacterized protein n=1 Tax=Collybiopsis luxurians FD-317 M1 TaxID=944289 RepID=A0A0D0C9G2_9AGAR|nr:hypothetical protein GYMLUDRAFT_245550 [Collybiopsis luxurians FD-317 M1]
MYGQKVDCAPINEDMGISSFVVSTYPLLCSTGIHPSSPQIIKSNERALLIFEDRTVVHEGHGRIHPSSPPVQNGLVNHKGEKDPSRCRNGTVVHVGHNFASSQARNPDQYLTAEITDGFFKRDPMLFTPSSHPAQTGRPAIDSSASCGRSRALHSDERNRDVGIHMMEGMAVQRRITMKLAEEMQEVEAAEGDCESEDLGNGGESELSLNRDDR